MFKTASLSFLLIGVHSMRERSASISQQINWHLLGKCMGTQKKASLRGRSPVQVRDRANKCIRLSAMVLNHQVAKIMLLEQIYRAWTILNGEPYHH